MDINIGKFTVILKSNTGMQSFYIKIISSGIFVRINIRFFLMKLLQMEKFLWGINFISDLWLIKENSISWLKYQLRLLSINK